MTLARYLVDSMGRPLSRDVYDHAGSRTLPAAHGYVDRHRQELESGAVIDGEFILGESLLQKRSERLERVV